MVRIIGPASPAGPPCNEVERFFCRLKRFRRIATRYDKLGAVFLAFIHFAVIYDALQPT